MLSKYYQEKQMEITLEIGKENTYGLIGYEKLE